MNVNPDHYRIPGWVALYGVNRKTAIHRGREYVVDIFDEQILAITARGNIIWMVVKDKYGQEQLSFIRALVLAPLGGRTGWKFRFYSERDPMKWVTCPESFLSQTYNSPRRNEKWRERVHEYHQKRRKHLKVGMRVKLIFNEVPEAIITRLNPLCGVYAGTEYRLYRRHIQLQEAS